MGAKPILFNTENVRALLEGRKTVTRRVVKPQPKGAHDVIDYDDEKHTADILCGNNGERGVFADWSQKVKAPFWTGDILWVRETWSPVNVRPRRYIYKADVDRRIGEGVGLPLCWHPSIHMPREAARIFLRVTGVRVERLRNITEEQAEAEGAPKAFEYDMLEDTVIVLDEDGYSYFGFQVVWNSTIKPADMPRYGWDANPWVWVIEFERCKKPDGWPG